MVFRLPAEREIRVPPDLGKKKGPRLLAGAFLLVLVRAAFQVSVSDPV